MRGSDRPDNASVTFSYWKNNHFGKESPLDRALIRQGQNAGNDLVRELEGAEAQEVEGDEADEVVKFIKQHAKETSNKSGSTLSDNVAGPSGVTPETTTMPGKRQKTDQGPATEAAVEPMEGVSPTAKKSGHNSSSDGGFDSAQGPISSLPQGGYKVTSGNMMFKKVHRMKSWAIPFFNLTEAATATNWCSTPLAQIPWEYAYFYLSPEEFALLPAGAYVHSVHLEIMQTVATTGYPTGGTTSTVATTNHPKVLVIGFDITKKLRGGQFKRLTLGSNGVPTATIAPNLATDFPAKQYGTDQTATDATIVIPGVSTKIPYYNYNYFCMYQPTAAEAITRGFTAATAPGYEYFSNAVTEINSNDVTWDKVGNYSYKFTSAPIGAQYPGLELQTDNFIHATGNAQLYNARRNVAGVNPNASVTITEQFGPSSQADIPIVTYSSSVMEKGATFVKGDGAMTPARQPTLGIGMRSIEKSSPDLGMSRAADFVQANIEFEITATMIISLPSYPNRFIKPKYYNTSLENAPAGTGYYPNDSNALVTWGLPSVTAAAPAVAAIDQANNEPTEDGLVTRLRVGRPRRDVPRVPIVHQKGTKQYKEIVKQK
uniref:VP n=1 Tax=uncultured densovirus TaxID=748192 RepID=A0A7L7YQF9_9VIRU|nr:VP [uncultured densovirus]